MRRRTLPRKLAASVTSVAIGVVAMLFAPAAQAAPAAEERSTVAVLERAALGARGAGLSIKVTASCPVGRIGYLEVRVTQAGEDSVAANGYAGRYFTCTGEEQKVRIGLTPSQSEIAEPFMAGSAFVDAYVSSCGNNRCSNDAAAGAVKVRDVTMEKRRFSGDGITLSLPDEATLEADGAGAVVKVHYTCLAGVSAYLYATLTQVTADSELTSSYDEQSLTCTDTDRRGVLSFHATSALWESGSAFVILNGDAYGCSDGTCDRPYAFRTLTII